MSVQRGFTLIEVMLALVIVALGATAVVATSNQYIKQSSDLRDRTVAQWVALNRLAEYRAERVFPDPGTERGDVVLDGQRWTWLAVVSPAPGEDDLRRIDVAVARATNPDAPVITVTGFVGRVVGFVQQPADGQ